jgi:16S rRNA processing protein RimM
VADYISIGKIVAVHGTKGEVVLQHALGKKTGLKNIKAIFTQEKEGTPFPWFLQAAKAKNESEILLKIEGVDDPETARKLLRKLIWLSAKDFDAYVSVSSPLSLIGFSIIENNRVIGEIAEVFKQPHQLLCTVIIDGKEALIPLHEESLKNIDRTSKQIHVDLPEGLLELYL